MAGLWDTAAFGVGSPAETAQQPAGLNDLVGGLYNYFGGIAKRAIGNSQTALDTGNYNSAPVLEAAMLPMGTGAIAGVPVKGAEAVLGAGPIRAYHGSPHEFDRFDLSKIGTGEGAQSYGHGLYFAEKEATAKVYRDALVARLPPPSPKISGTVAADGMPEFVQRVPRPRGRMYEVNIHTEPEKLLNWDEPFWRQPHEVQKILKDVMPGVDESVASFSGRELYREANVLSRLAARKVGGTPTGNKWGADLLNEAGIPGIKYLDQGSRGAGQGSSNYVVFNDKIIDIMRKYGIALPGGAAAADAYMRSHEPAT